jgi:hypothetical protein
MLNDFVLQRQQAEAPMLQDGRYRLIVNGDELGVDANGVELGGEIQLAEVTITITGAIGSSLILEPATLGGTFAGNIGFNSGVNFDAANVSTSGATITIIPEPHAFAVSGLVLSMVIGVRGRRQNQR